MEFIVILALLPVCFGFTEAAQKTGSRQIRSADAAEGNAQVVSTYYCHSCLQEDAKGLKGSYDLLPAYAVLSSDHTATFGPNFTICVSASNPGGHDQLHFTILGQDENVAIQAYLKNGIETATPIIIFGKDIVAHFPNTSVPLVFLHQWVRSCISMSSQSGYVQWVIDGLVIENTTLEALKETENNIPKNLAGKLFES